MPKVLLVISATLANVSPTGPRKDYCVLADKLEAEVIDYASVQESLSARAVKRVLGMAAAQAWLAFRRRNDVEAILTDGEHIGIPLALLLKLVNARTAHVTIGHRITAAKKRPFFRFLRVQSHISRIALHARSQFELGTRDLSIEQRKLALVPYQVDTEFWRPQAAAEERLICSAGLEFRDYPTLMAAVEGLDAKVVIGAASHWSKRRNTADGGGQPSNVTVDSFDYDALRSLYARSAIVVVPLDDTDFQAGVTTILEAMSMGKPVVVTHSVGQTDVVEDRRTITRGAQPRTRPSSLLRAVAEQAGVALEPSGFYVPPSDPQALRRAIAYLLEHPEERARLGAAGRRTVEQLTTVDQYAARLRELVDAAIAEAPPRRIAHRGVPVVASAE
ncbi:MAG: glycosyltransferase family 4 protein [Chloroflexi bacterium]|nr:glycosyltransferase family 4 protein [Chloroflexota bacterium]MBV9893823.1 glycosyltransferase family 4 protein [Chloroflexota bacterium]